MELTPGLPDISRVLRNQDLMNIFLCDRETAARIQIGLAQLDTDFQTGVAILDDVIDKYRWKFIKIRNFDKATDDLLKLTDYIVLNRKSRVAQATSKVFLDAFYVEPTNTSMNKLTPVVIKVFKHGISRKVLFYETVINILVDYYTRNDDTILAPKIYRVGVIRLDGKRSPIIVQEYIKAMELQKIDRLEYLVAALKRCCMGFDSLFRSLRFSHRDFHGENVMYDVHKDRIIFIDFGYSCITLPNTQGSIQIKKNIYGWDLDAGPALVSCKNRSHDICTLLLALYLNNPLFKRTHEQLCLDICNAYRREILKRPGAQEFIQDIKYNLSDISPKIDEPGVFHFWYCYELYSIELQDFLPEKIFRILNTKLLKM